MVEFKNCTFLMINKLPKDFKRDPYELTNETFTECIFLVEKDNPGILIRFIFKKTRWQKIINYLKKTRWQKIINYLKKNKF